MVGSFEPGLALYVKHWVCTDVYCVGSECCWYVCVCAVLYCSLLAQAQSDADKQKIMKQMESDSELVKILHQLQETDKEDIVHEERERRQAARKSRVEMDLDAMDTDDAGVSTCYYQLAMPIVLHSFNPFLSCQSRRPTECNICNRIHSIKRILTMCAVYSHSCHESCSHANTDKLFTYSTART